VTNASWVASPFAMHVYSTWHLLFVFWLPLAVIALSYGLLVARLRHGARHAEKELFGHKMVSRHRVLTRNRLSRKSSARTARPCRRWSVRD